MSFIAVDYNKCVGCRNCEFACAYHNHNTCNPIFASIRVNVSPEEYLALPFTCMHCENAWCMNICPKGAIYKDNALGRIVVDQQLCAGCKSCIVICPFGNMHFDSLRKTAFNCDLCDGEPACVRHCVAGALTYSPDNNYDAVKRETVQKKIAHLLTKTL